MATANDATPVTPRDWLKSAMLARALAAQLGDIEAKRVMEEVADDCELIAQDLGATIDSLSKVPPDTRAEHRADDEDAAFG